LGNFEEDVMSLLTTIEADLGKVGHAFVIGAVKLKAVIIQAAGVVDKAEPEIKVIEDLANGVAEQIYPGAGLVMAAIEAGMNKVFNAVDAAGAAAAADGLNLQLDAATVAAIKAALPTVKAQAATTPGS
jgi:hypothetical protein